MGFYYFSIFSLVPLGFAYGALALVFWGITRLMRNMPGRKVILAVVGMVFLVLPVAEELWIAWNFGQACKEAGTFITKRVTVEGFYDDTTHWWRQLTDSKYQFVESREQATNKYWRVEREGDKLRHYSIAKPTARYHFKKLHEHTKLSHEVKKFEYVVTDSERNEQIAREMTYARGANWFFIGLDRPTIFCPISGRHGEKLNVLLYNAVLKPESR